MSRRLVREVAFRVLFQIDIGKGDPEQALRYSREGFRFSAAEETFLRELIYGALEQREALDAIIRSYLVRWELERLSAVDRNLIRLALYEILHRPDIPAAVSINEALELAKKYGSSGESVAFINSVLDRAVGEALQEGN